MKINKLALLIGMGIFAASCTSKSVPSKTDTDDMYVRSDDLVLPGSLSSAKNPATEVLPYNDNFDRAVTSNQGSTDEYFDEGYVTSRDLKRKVGNGVGYTDGYADGYSQGWSDNSWTFAGSGRFYNSPFGFSPFRTSMMYPYYGSFINIGFGSMWNSWYDPWDPFYSYGFGRYPYFGYNNFYSPWNYYNSFYSPWDYYGYGYRNPYYGYQNIIVNNNYFGNGSRTVRERSTSIANSRYNDRLVNRTAAANTRALATNRSVSARNSSVNVRESAANARVNSSAATRATRSYDTYSREANASSRVNSSSRIAPSSSRVSSPNYSRGEYSTPAARPSTSTYSRPSSSRTNSEGSMRSSSPSSSRGSSPSYNSSSRSSSPSYSSPSRSSSSSSSSGMSSSRSSSGSSSRGRN